MTKSKTPPPLLSCYDDLAGSLDHAWRLLSRAVADRRCAFHTPSVATLGIDGAPQIRTVVLRGCDVDRRQLRFHTDRRAPKIREITANPQGAMHFYDAGQKIQLRLGCRFQLADDALHETAWQATRPMSRACYQVTEAPGTVIDAPERALFDADQTKDGEVNFQPVLAHIDTMEWLYLAARGHRRAHFDFTQEPIKLNWLIP